MRNRRSTWWLWIAALGAVSLLSGRARAQEAEPYPMTLDWGTGLISQMNWMTRWELEHPNGRDPNSLLIYNYHKLNLAVGYSGNLVDSSNGFILRGHITELTREQQRLRFEIAARNRRIRGLEVALAEAQNGELATIQQRRAELQKRVDAEQEEIRKAEDRLRELERHQQQRPQEPPQPPTTA